MKNYIAPLGNTNTSGITIIGNGQCALVAAIEACGQEHPWSLDELRSELEHGDAFHFGAFTGNGGQLAAYILSRKVLDELHIHRLCTHPEFRRRGFARALIGHALERAQSQGICTAFLEVAAQNHAAVALYKTAGFLQETVRKNYYTNGDDALIMIKTIGKETETP